MREMPRWVLGVLTVLALSLLKKLPTAFLFSLGKGCLPVYLCGRAKNTARINKLLSSSPFHLELFPYYQIRLQIALFTLINLGSRVEIRTQFRGEHHFLSSLAQNKPVLLLGLHAGPFEWLHEAPLEFSRNFGKSLHILTAPTFAVPLTSYLKGLRTKPGKILYSGEGITSFLRHGLRENAVSAMMVDQSPKRNSDSILLWSSIRVPVDIKTLEWFADQGGILMGISCLLGENNSLQVEFETPFENSPGEIWEERTKKIKNYVKNFLEISIGRSPAQWNWSYPGLKMECMEEPAAQRGLK